MHHTSFNKITDAGFTFYRFRWDPVANQGTIWSATVSGKWRKHTAEIHLTKASLERAKKSLLDNDPMAVCED